MSIHYKLSNEEKNDLISCCVISYGSIEYKLDNINPLPYGYLFSLKDKEGEGNVFVVNISDNGKHKEYK